MKGATGRPIRVVRSGNFQVLSPFAKLRCHLTAQSEAQSLCTRECLGQEAYLSLKDIILPRSRPSPRTTAQRLEGVDFTQEDLGETCSTHKDNETRRGRGDP